MKGMIYLTHATISFYFIFWKVFLLKPITNDCFLFYFIFYFISIDVWIRCFWQREFWFDFRFRTERRGRPAGHLNVRLNRFLFFVAFLVWQVADKRSPPVATSPYLLTFNLSFAKEYPKRIEIEIIILGSLAIIELTPTTVWIQMHSSFNCRFIYKILRYTYVILFNNLFWLSHLKK